LNILFFHIGTPSPILETELELIRKHEKIGDHVLVLQCTGEIQNCHWNLEHLESICSVCRSKFQNGWAALKPGNSVVLKSLKVNDAASFNFPDSFESVEAIKSYRYDDVNIGFGVAASLISSQRDHRFDTNKYYKDIIRTLKTSIQVYSALKIEFENFKPDEVYLFNGRIATHLPAVLLCRKLGVNYHSYEAANKENSYWLNKNATVHTPPKKDEVDVIRSNWTVEHESKAKLFLNNKRNGEAIENIINYVEGQKKDALPKSFNTKYKNIAIFNSTIDEYASIEGWNVFYLPDETVGIEKIINDFHLKNYFFYLRVHPNMKGLSKTTSQLVDIRQLSEKYKNLEVIWPEDKVDTYALIDACDKVITFGSTVGAEATYWGKPSILLGQAMYENFNCVYSPDTHEELINLLSSELNPMPVDGALLYAFWEVNRGSKFQYFKQIGVKQGLAYGTFDGVEIKPDSLPALWYKISIFPWRVKRVVLQPSLIFKKLKKYFKVIH
jgi:hypothetical protein